MRLIGLAEEDWREYAEPIHEAIHRPPDEGGDTRPAYGDTPTAEDLSAATASSDVLAQAQAAMGDAILEIARGNDGARRPTTS